MGGGLNIDGHHKFIPGHEVGDDTITECWYNFRDAIELSMEVNNLNFPYEVTYLVDTPIHDTFRSTCTVMGQACDFMIDSGKCANLISRKIVEKMGLSIESHLESPINCFAVEL